MKPKMLLVLSFLHLALAIFFGGAVVAQPPSATVLDIYGNHVLAKEKYYIYEPRGKTSPDRFRVIGLSKTDDKVYLYDQETEGTAVIISQEGKSELVVDTALEIRFDLPSNYTQSHYWKVDKADPDPGRNYFVKIGGHNEGYEFKLAQNEAGKSHHLYCFTYTSVPLFCENCETVGIRLLDKYFVARAGLNETAFQFAFVPVEESSPNSNSNAEVDPK